MKLWPHQKKDYKLIKKDFKKHQHILFSAPTGYGKTVLLGRFVYDTVKKMVDRGETVLIIAPRIKLINQFRDALYKYGFSPSDISIHQGANTRTYKTAKIHIGSTSTLNARLKADINYLGVIDNVLVDEVHINFKKLVMKTVYDLYWDSAKWLGVSATPIDGKGHRLEGYDHTIANTQTKDLVDMGYLLDLDLYVEDVPDLSNVSLNSLGDYKLEELEDTMNASAITTNVYNVWAKKFKKKKTMIFCVDIKHCEAVAQHFIDNGINTGVSHSKLTAKQDEKVMQEFKTGEKQVLVSVNKLTTGFDEPSVEVLITLRPTKTLSLMIQSVGRVLRLHNSMDKAIMIDCAGWYDEFGHPFNRRNFNKVKGDVKLLTAKLEDEDEVKLFVCPFCKNECLTGDLRTEIEQTKKKIKITKFCLSCDALVDEKLQMKKKVKKIKKIRYQKPVKRAKIQSFLEYLARDKGYAEGWVYFKMKLYKYNREKMSEIYRKCEANEIKNETAIRNIVNLESE